MKVLVYLAVKSRLIVNALGKDLGLLLLPFFQGGNGRDVAEGPLRNRAVIESNIAREGVLEAFGGMEACGGQDLADAAVETLDHPVGLAVAGLDEAMLDAMLGAALVKRMGTARRTLAGAPHRAFAAGT